MERDLSRDNGDQAAWRELVARLEFPSPVDPASVPWPDRENLHQAPPPAARERGEGPGDGEAPGPGPARGHVVRPADPQRAGRQDAVPGAPDDPEPGFLDFLDEIDDPDDPESRYVPPSLPPAPGPDPVAKAAWLALFGGPGYLLVATMLGWQTPGWAELLAVAAFVTGFVVLVSRLGDGPSRKDGPDQGAVV